MSASAKAPVTTLLKDGDAYRESLRDGRDVWMMGERIEDVTTHPLTKPGVDFEASLYEAQLDPETQDILTYVRDDGTRVTRSWQIPRTREDLDARARENEFRYWASFGALHGRQPNHVALALAGQVGHISVFREHAPDYADNLLANFNRCQEENLHVAASMIEPQGTRARSAKAGEDRSAVCQVVRRDSNGIYISGGKAVATASVTAHELVVGSIYYPHVRPAEAFWCMVPMNASGLRLLCREPTGVYGSDFNHPVGSIGEEFDALVLLDEVFVPYERVWALDAPKTCDPGLFLQTSRAEFWNHLHRAVIKAEMFAGIAQLLVDILELKDIVLVQDKIGEISQYAKILRGGLIAATELATEGPDGMLFPDLATLCAFRSWGLDAYPRINQMIQELSSQGLVTRFSEADYDRPDLGPSLELYLATKQMSAKDRNKLMNLIWDLTSSAHAGRTQIFENVNGLSGSLLRHLLFFHGNRGEHAQQVLDLVGLRAPRGADGPAAQAGGAWISTKTAGDGQKV